MKIYTFGELIEKGEAKVKMYASHDTWQGVTYKEDKPGVMVALAQLKEEGYILRDYGDSLVANGYGLR